MDKVELTWKFLLSIFHIEIYVSILFLALIVIIYEMILDYVGKKVRKKKLVWGFGASVSHL